jgi:hypothetical protein
VAARELIKSLNSIYKEFTYLGVKTSSSLGQFYANT